MLLSAKVKNSFSLSRDIPLHILNTSMRSCLFRLFSSVHNFTEDTLWVYCHMPDFALIGDELRTGSARIQNQSNMCFCALHGRQCKPVVVKYGMLEYTLGSLSFSCHLGPDHWSQGLPYCKICGILAVVALFGPQRIATNMKYGSEEYAMDSVLCTIFGLDWQRRWVWDPKYQNFVKTTICWRLMLRYTNWCEIWLRQACHRFMMACQLSPCLVKGWVLLSSQFYSDSVLLMISNFSIMLSTV